MREPEKPVVTFPELVIFLSQINHFTFFKVDVQLLKYSDYWMP